MFFARLFTKDRQNPAVAGIKVPTDKTVSYSSLPRLLSAIQNQSVHKRVNQEDIFSNNLTPAL